MAIAPSQRFIDALHQLEASNDPGPLVALHHPDCTVGNNVAPHEFAGQQGAREFWQIYRATFDQVESTFRNVIAAEDRIALEWTTIGTAPDGSPVQYDGVSILEWNADQISRFRAYFNASALGRQITTSAGDERAAGA